MSHSILTFSGKWRFLSNFYPSLVEHEGVVYPSTEHAFQAAKTLDPIVRTKIAKATTAAMAKRLGRTVDMRSDWNVIRNEVMFRICVVKFSEPRLNALLLATGERHLEEGNTWGDRYWGVCDGVGENHLGRTLMLVRDCFASGL